MVRVLLNRLACEKPTKSDKWSVRDLYYNTRFSIRKSSIGETRLAKTIGKFKN